MSPAAVDIQSPITSKSSSSSSLQNPNPIFAAAPSNNDHQEPRVFGNASEFGLSSQSGQRSGPGRVRPRLVKVRKQSRGRTRASAGEPGPGFNPFQSVIENSGHFSDYCTKNALNLNSKLNVEELGSKVESLRSENGGFVFGVKVETGVNDNEAKSFSKAENGKLGNKNELDGSGVGLASGDQAGKGNLGSEAECRKGSNMGFEIDLDGCGVRSNLSFEKREFSKEAAKLDSDNVGFMPAASVTQNFGVFGVSQFNLQPDLNEDKKQPGDSRQSVAQQDSGNVGFVFGNGGTCTRNDYSANYRVSGSNFVFGVGGFNLQSDLCKQKKESSESSESVAKPDSDNVEFNSSAAHSDSSANCRVFGSDFVFGVNRSNLQSDLNENKKESGEISGSSVSDDAEGETEPHAEKNSAVKFDIRKAGSLKKDNNKCTFVFGSGIHESSSLNNFVTMNCSDEVKFSFGTFENCNSFAKGQDNNIYRTVNDKYKDGSFHNSRNVPNSSITTPEYNISDGIRKLNIDDFKNVYVAESENSSTNADPLFVFGSSKMASVSCNGSSDGCTSYGRKSECSASAPRGNDDDKFQASDKNKNFCNFPTASVGKYSSESFTFQEGLARSSIEDHPSQGQGNNDSEPSSLSSIGINYKEDDDEPATIAKAGEKNDESSFTNTPEKQEVLFTDFKMPNLDPSWLKTSLFPEFNKKMEFSVNGRLKGAKKLKATKGKSKQSSLHNIWPKRGHVQNESTVPETQNSPGCYSPMDFSPYEDTAAAEQSSGETAPAENGSIRLDNNHASSVLHSAAAAGPKDGEGLDVNKEDEKSCRRNVQNSERCSIHDFLSDGFVFGAATTCSSFKTKQACSGTGITSTEDMHGNRESNHQVQLCFASGLEDIDGTKFSFSASSSVQHSSSARKRLHIKRNRRKVHCEPFVTAPSLNAKDQGDLSTQSKVDSKAEANEQQNRDSIASIVAIQEACETWRLRGNHAYKNGDLSKAEDLYTCGINSVPANETSGCCLKPLIICYSNRAATRMSLGNMREALRDCAMAAALDPDFIKAHMRAANCHLVLGEVKEAEDYFNKCLSSGAGVCLDRKITIDAADGLQRAQKVAECTNHCAKLLEQKTCEAVHAALDAIVEAMSISPYSERLLEMKAESMFRLRKYEEVVQLCEQTLSAAEKNFSVGIDVEKLGIGGSQNCSLPRLWRMRLISKSYFYLGRLEMALDLLEKLEKIGPTSDKYQSKILESAVSLAATIRDLLHHKSSGNEAVRSGRYAEAIEHYTAALSSNVESRPFTAICVCNRAAAHQALGQIADAIADCSLAIALDKKYSKAVSRRATLHEMIKDYGQAASDLQRLVSILENQSNDKASESGTPGKSTSGMKQLRQARRRLSLMEEEAKKETTLDLYLILGIKESDTASDIKKAYRKAALRHHPDKAGQFLVRSESGDEGQLWKEIVQEIHMDADRLFKMIGEAYAVLSDPAKRSQYDLDEKIRKESKENSGSSSHRKTPDTHSYPFGRSDYRQSWQGSWKTHGYSQSRW